MERASPSKDRLLPPDFPWIVGRHNLCRPASLLVANGEVEERVTVLTKETGGAVGLPETEERAETNGRAAREGKPTEELERMRHRKAKLVNPLPYALVICAMDLETHESEFPWESAAPTQK